MVAFKYNVACGWSFKGLTLLSYYSKISVLVYSYFGMIFTHFQKLSFFVYKNGTKCGAHSPCGDKTNVRRIVPGTNVNARRIVDNPLDKRRNQRSLTPSTSSTKIVSKRNQMIGID